MREFFKIVGQSALLTILVATTINLGFAQVMSSSNYQIQSDSVNFGGGFSTSTNYQLESTIGEVGTGPSDSASFSLGAGYLQTLESYIALSADGDVNLSPSIPGISGGFATGSTTVTVITDSLGGYELSIRAENDPAMQSGANSIADYVPGGAVPDYDFTVGAADAYFGYSPEGADIVQRFRDNGSNACNEAAGSDTTDRCWDGLTTSDVVISAGSGSNHPAGTDTEIKFQVGIGGSVVQPIGSYVATTTITAVAI